MYNRNGSSLGMIAFLIFLVAVFLYLFDKQHQRNPDILSWNSCIAGYRHSLYNGQARQVLDANGKGIPCNN